LILGAMNMQASFANIESLLMPGEVIEDHAEFEAECTSCHVRFAKSTQTGLCLDCHEEISADLEALEGFHGLTEEIADTECKVCHSDHLGREADVVGLDKEIFDHTVTDFELKGSHQKTQCEACHEADLQYRDAPSECFDCHKEDDNHKGRLGEVCGDCHVESAWRDAKFDHDETDFPLEGNHEDASCNGCHANERYEDTPTECYACHRLDDVHRGSRGQECDNCHSPRDWESVLFDHSRDTDFPLEGQHNDVSCDSCHEDGVFEKEMDPACFACHKSDDDHQGRNGEECDKCHAPQAWSEVAFDHDNDTDFPLEYRHAEVECEACHRGMVFEQEMETSCFACHRNDDAHDGQEGEDCGRCHDESGWTTEVVFDHDLTRFPLNGLHATVPCEECHLTTTFKDTPLECVECHEDDDSHEKTLGPECERCHNPNDWALWTFDHDTETDFELEGAHEDLACAACHREPIEEEIVLSMTCASCHQQDDVHSGRFGRNCQRCHSAESFKEIRIGQ